MTTNFKKGLSIYGVPVLPETGGTVTTGNVYFVDSGNADGADESATAGTSIDKPFVTVDYAINQCTCNNGDVIYVMPGHAENIPTSNTFIPDTEGVSIIGLGRGNSRPTFTSSSAAGTIAITGRGTRISNCIFHAGTTATAIKVTTGMKIEARDVMVDNCKWSQSGSSSFFVKMIIVSSSIGAVSGAKVISNEFLSVETASSGCSRGLCLAVGSSLVDVTSDDILIAHNTFKGYFDDAAIHSNSSGVVHTGVVIKGNDIWNPSLISGCPGIDINNAITGLCIDNRMGCIGSTDLEDDIFDPGSMLNSENYCANTVDETGAPAPLTVASSC